LAVSGKFVAVLILAKEGGARDVGAFALFYGGINILTYVIGLDFHLFAIREALGKRTGAGQLRIVCGQAVFDFAIYGLLLFLASIPLVLGVPTIAAIPVFWLATILVSDHLAQELSRLFTILKRPLAANIIYALKTGLWGWVGAALIQWAFIPAAASSFYALWLSANMMAVALGFFWARRFFAGVRPSLPPRYHRWLRRGLGVSRFFYITSVASISLGILDRFIIAERISLAQAGLYSFWQSITGMLPIVVYAMAGMHFLPRLVEAYRRRRFEAFAAHHRSFFWRSLILGFACGLGVVAAAPFIPALLGKPEFEAPLLLVALLAGGACLNALWQVSYQVLYSASEDRFLAAWITGITATSVAANFLAVEWLGIMGAACVSLAANLAMYLVLRRGSWQVLEKNARRGLSPPMAQMGP